MIKNKKYLGFLLLIVCFLIFIGFNIYISKRYDENHTFKNVNLNTRQQSILNIPKTTKTPLTLEKNFPAKWVLDSFQYPSFNEIRMVLNWMDSLNQDKNQNQKFLASVLTDSLQNKLSPHFNLYNLDSLNTLLIWAEKMKAYSEVDANYQMFFKVVSSHWINFIANNVSVISEENTSLKYTFKFKYLVSKCFQNGNIGSIKITKTEKIINYAIEGKWAYLMNKFLFGTSNLFKIILVGFCSLILFSFYCLFLFIRKKI